MATALSQVETYVTYWIFVSKSDDFCTSFYSRGDALDWIAEQPAGKSYDIIRMEKHGNKTTCRTVQSIDRRKG